MSFSPEIYAIDFGTSNSLLSAANSQQCHYHVPMEAGTNNNILKSILYASSPKEWFFGQNAIDEYLDQVGHGRIFKSIKRFLPEAGFKRTSVFGSQVTIEELLAKFLTTMRDRANTFFNTDIKKTVMGCPARFSSSDEAHELALTRLKKAALLAGFDEVHFLPEPVAAAYRFQKNLNEEKLVLIADFGGGTSDFTVQKMSSKPFSIEDVLSINGISMAGDRYDGKIMEHAVSPHLGAHASYKTPTATKPSRFPAGFARRMSSPADMIMMNKKSVMTDLKETIRWVIDPKDKERLENLIILVEDCMSYALFRDIENTKISLSSNNLAHFDFEYVDINIHSEISKQQFHDWSKATTDEIMRSLDECLLKATIKAEDIDIVCLTGGTSLLPPIREQLQSRFGDKLTTSSSFDSVVHGLAERAKQISSDS